jgi:hypothetical protein
LPLSAPKPSSSMDLWIMQGKFCLKFLCKFLCSILIFRVSDLIPFQGVNWSTCPLRINWVSQYIEWGPICCVADSDDGWMIPFAIFAITTTIYNTLYLPTVLFIQLRFDSFTKCQIPLTSPIPFLLPIDWPNSPRKSHFPLYPYFHIMYSNIYYIDIHQDHKLSSILSGE